MHVRKLGSTRYLDAVLIGSPICAQRYKRFLQDILLCSGTVRTEDRETGSSAASACFLRADHDAHAHAISNICHEGWHEARQRAKVHLVHFL